MLTAAGSVAFRQRRIEILEDLISRRHRRHTFHILWKPDLLLSFGGIILAVVLKKVFSVG